MFILSMIEFVRVCNFFDNLRNLHNPAREWPFFLSAFLLLLLLIPTVPCPLRDADA